MNITTSVRRLAGAEMDLPREGSLSENNQTA